MAVEQHPIRVACSVGALCITQDLPEVAEAVVGTLQLWLGLERCVERRPHRREEPQTQAERDQAERSAREPPRNRGRERCQSEADHRDEIEDRGDLVGRAEQRKNRGYLAPPRHGRLPLMANVTRLTLGRADHRFTMRPSGGITAGPPMRRPRTERPVDPPRTSGPRAPEPAFCASTGRAKCGPLVHA
jgi:hypothetical protein